MIKSYDDELPETALQQDKIHQALIAILDNAEYYLKTTDNLNNRKLLIKTAKLSSGEDNSFIQISIGNTGTKIPDNILDNIFDPFFTSKPAGHGIGLGLTNCYNDVKSLGGTVFVSKNTTEIVEFTINLPLIN